MGHCNSIHFSKNFTAQIEQFTDLLTSFKNAFFFFETEVIKNKELLFLKKKQSKFF